LRLNAAVVKNIRDRDGLDTGRVDAVDLAKRSKMPKQADRVSAHTKCQSLAVTDAPF
jgi:hypothetical protein